MSTCPEKDIHSIYLDNELPKNYALEYEKHIASCAKCRAKLEKIKATHEIFALDSNSLKLDSVFLDQSFERLQDRMRYKKVVDKATKIKKINFQKIDKYLPAAVAAALVFAIMLPLNINQKNKAYDAVVNLAQIQAINKSSDVLINQNQLLSETSHVVYPISLLESSSKEIDNSFSFDNFSPLVQVSDNHFHVRKFNSQRRRARRYSNLLNYDVFMSEFATEDSSENVLQVFYMPSYVDISSLNK